MERKTILSLPILLACIISASAWQTSLDNTNAYERYGAVSQLKDQTVLTKFALEDTYFLVRLTAVEKLTDQVMLAKIAMEDKDSRVCETAVDKLTDQSLLAKIAVEHKDYDIRYAAVEKLTNQVLLAKVAADGKGINIDRLTAIAKLMDQDTLAKIAEEDQDTIARLTAVRNLTDQVVLEKIFVEATNSQFRLATVTKFTDQSFLTKIAGNMDRSTTDTIEAIARMRLALQDPIIITRIPNAQLDVVSSPMNQNFGIYQGNSEIQSGSFSVWGESIQVKICQSSNVLVEDRWNSDYSKVESTSTRFLHATAHLSTTMGKLFSRSDLEFTHEDLLTLTHSHIPEVRAGALANFSP